MNATVKETNAPLMLKGVRLAFPNLFTPQEPMQAGGGRRYTATLIIPPDHPQLARIRKDIERVAMEKWPKDGAARLKQFIRKDDVALHDGNDKAKYDGFENNFYISCAAPESKRPLVVDRDKTPLTEADGVIYAGCYVNASIEFYVQDNHGRQGVNCALRGIQFLKDGAAFGAGRPASPDEFEDVSEGADAEEFGDEEEVEKDDLW